MLGASTSPFRGHNLGALIDESLQCLRILIINVPFALDAEKALFLLHHGAGPLGVIHHKYKRLLVKKVYPRS